MKKSKFIERLKNEAAPIPWAVSLAEEATREALARAGRADAEPWDPEEPELPERISEEDLNPFDGVRHPGLQELSRQRRQKIRREAAARYNAVERFLSGLEDATSGEVVERRTMRGVQEDRITLSVFRMVLREERERLS